MSLGNQVLEFFNFIITCVSDISYALLF